MNKIVSKLNNIFSRQALLYISTIYVSYRIVLNNDNNRFVQFAFFIYSLIYFVYTIFKDNKILLNKKYIFACLLFCSAIITFLINKTFDAMCIRSLFMIIFNFVILLVCNPNDSKREIVIDFANFALLVSAIATIYSIVSIAGAITDFFKITNTGFFQFDRLGGITGYSTSTGSMALCAIGCNIFIYFAIKQVEIGIFSKRGLLTYIFITSILQFIVVILCQSRSSMYSMIIGSILTTIFYIYYKGKNNVNTKKIIKGISIGLVTIVILLFVLSRFITIRPISFSDSNRFKIWQTFFQLIDKKNLLFGIGPTNFSKLCSEYYHKCLIEQQNLYNAGIVDTEYVGDVIASIGGRLTHNEYVREIMLFGLVGLGIFITYIVYVFCKQKRIFDIKGKTFNPFILASPILFITPLLEGCVENHFSITNSPRYFETLVFFVFCSFVIQYAQKEDFYDTEKI